MRLTLEVNNTSKSPIKEAFFKAIAKKTLEKAGLDFLKNKKISISLAIVGKMEIKKINRTYRKINQSTDILSFAEYKNARELRREIEKGEKEDIFLGELILCYDDIKEYARKYDLNLKKEAGMVVSHGILHLIGFSHGKKMFGIQNEIIK